MDWFYSSGLYRELWNNPGLLLLTVVVALGSVFAVLYTYSDRFGRWLYWRFPALWVRLPRNSFLTNLIHRVVGSDTAAACQLFWTTIGRPVKQSAVTVGTGYVRAVTTPVGMVLVVGVFLAMIAAHIGRGDFDLLVTLATIGILAVPVIAVGIVFWVLRFIALYLCPIKFKVENGDSPNN